MFKNFLKFSKKLFANQKIIEEKLKTTFNPEILQVVDTSGNCGQAFVIHLRTSAFKGKTLIQQHRMVNETLKEEIKDIHSLQLKTEATL